jgi:hypothetical protein
MDWDVLGVEYVEGEFALIWDPPNCFKLDFKIKNFLMKNEKYPPIPEAEDPNFGDKES